MAAKRPIKPSSSPSKRTPKVAGRTGARVTVPKPVEKTAEVRTANVGTADVGTANVGTANVRSGASTGGVSGVERKRRAAAERDVREQAERSQETGGTPPRDTEAALRTAAVIGAIAVVLGVIATVLALHPGADVSDNRAFVDQSTTDQVLGQTRSAACAPFQYDYKTVDRWIDSTRDQFTGEALTQFEDNLKVTTQIIKQAQSSSECQVDQMGVESIDGDHASVIGTLVVSETSQGNIKQSLPHIRYDVKREDGTWRINAIGGF